MKTIDAILIESIAQVASEPPSIDSEVRLLTLIRLVDWKAVAQELQEEYRKVA